MSYERFLVKDAELESACFPISPLERLLVSLSGCKYTTVFYSAQAFLKTFFYFFSPEKQRKNLELITKNSLVFSGCKHITFFNSAKFFFKVFSSINTSQKKKLSMNFLTIAPSLSGCKYTTVF